MKRITSGIFVLLITQLAFSQTISELAGAIKTDFEITSLGKPIGVIEQYIIKRSEQITGSDTYSEGIGMYGLGYESYHLEFTASKAVESIDVPLPGKIYKKYPSFDFYELVFWGNNDQKIFRVFLKTWRLNIYHDNIGEIEGYTYSLDLKDIPLIVLNNTKKIEIFRPKITRMY